MKLPPKCHARGRKVYYVDKGQWHPIALATDDEYVIRAELAKFKRGRNRMFTEVAKHYVKNALVKLAPDTQRSYTAIIEGPLTRAFGAMRIHEIEPQDVAMYLEARDRQGHAASGNREMAVLGSIWNHVIRQGWVKGRSPTLGIRRNKERPKTRYVENDELRRAMRRTSHSFRLLLWSAYLTGLRQKDLITMKREQVTPEGLLLTQSKDGKHVLIEWTESLRKVVRRALAKHESNYVFTNERGARWEKWAIQSAMRRLKAGWTFHDLRAKAESDHATGMGLMTRYKRARRVRAVK
ncbi:MAG: tyrosine-type recombinase/integrase [Pseudomonadota bacterium]